REGILIDSSVVYGGNPGQLLRLCCLLLLDLSADTNCRNNDEDPEFATPNPRRRPEPRLLLSWRLYSSGIGVGLRGEKARPFYEAKRHAACLQMETAHRAALRYERSCRDACVRTKDFVRTARGLLIRHRPAWSGRLSNRNSTLKSTREKVRICKRLYDEALRTLEAISESIHTRRREENNSFSAAKPPLPPSSSSSANSAFSFVCVCFCGNRRSVAKPRRRKSLRNSVATPIMSLLEDAMRYEQQHRLNHQLKSGTAASLSLPRSPSNHSTASSLDDEVLASFVVNPSASTAGNANFSTRSQSPFATATAETAHASENSCASSRLRKFLHSLDASEQQQRTD
uniref:DUF630 domain-containing protein n=1 Tax=Macrostomum lignano TaxID=282301 RepID=A0A1I8F7V8_9PLAT